MQQKALLRCLTSCLQPAVCFVAHLPLVFHVIASKFAPQVVIDSRHVALHCTLVVGASAHSWHAMQVSIVSQEPILFAESIMHNIAYGMPGGSASVSLAMVRPCPAPFVPSIYDCHMHRCSNGIRTASVLCAHKQTAQQAMLNY